MEGVQVAAGREEGESEAFARLTGALHVHCRREGGREGDRKTGDRREREALTVRSCVSARCSSGAWRHRQGHQRRG